MELEREKCDNCHRIKYPILTEFKFFGRKWAICPGCARSLGLLMRHKAAVIVIPDRRSPKAGTRVVCR